jgi:hypothetical protein
MFAPMAALFVMQFRDMNRWVLRFPEPRDEYKWIIDSGTREDETHSRLFMEDWRKLNLDPRLGWKTSDMSCSTTRRKSRRHFPSGPGWNTVTSASTTYTANTEGVFDAMESQLWRSLALARANKFAVR